MRHVQDTRRGSRAGGGGKRPEEGKAPRLALRFALTTIVGLAVAGGCIVYLVRGYFIRSGENAAAAHAELVSQLVLGNRLRTTDFATPSEARRRQLVTVLRVRGKDAETLGIALYTSDGRLVASTGPLPASTASAPSVVRRAAGARVITSLTAPAATSPRLTLLEELVPIRFGRKPVGVAAFATDYGRITTTARNAWLPISITVEALLALLFAALVPPIRRATKLVRAHVHESESRALHDALTGLPNRRLFEDRIAQAMAKSQRDRLGAAVMLVDLDRFKQINDTVGHAAGDALLQEVARRLAAVVRDHDTVARLGGDEFAIVLAGADDEAALDTAVRMREAIERPVEFDGMSLEVGASIGIALHPEHGATVAALMERADAAMYEAKRDGLGFLAYEASDDGAEHDDQLLASELRDAVERGEITLHYQPTIEVATGEVAGVEALLRWHHPSRGLLPANRFMGLAERAGASRRLLDFALAEAIRQAGAWRRDGIELAVSVNLDAATLVDTELPARLESLFAEHGVDAEQIRVEVPARALAGEAARLQKVAIELAAVGVSLAVDNFGSDHSSLASLGLLPIEVLKLDRAFVGPLAESPRDRIIARAIVDLAHRLRLRVVAEGVADAAAFELAQQLGVDEAQGYHLGAPAPAAAIAALTTTPIAA